MMTAATGFCSSTQRVATFPIETPMLACDPGQRIENGLQHIPPADLLDETKILHRAPVGDFTVRRLVSCRAIFR